MWTSIYPCVRLFLIHVLGWSVHTHSCSFLKGLIMQAVSQKRTRSNTEQSSVVMDLSVDQILPDPHQPRKKFNEKALNELADSIKARGLQQLPLVNYGYHKDGKDFYFIKAGERRWRAHQVAGIGTISCIVEARKYKGVLDVERTLSQAAENACREPHTHVEIVDLVALVFREERATREVSGYGAVSATLQKVAKAFGKSEEWARNYHILTRLTPDLRMLLDEEDDEKRLSFQVACKLALVPKDRQVSVLEDAKKLREKGGYAATLTYIANQARGIRTERGEKVRGRKPHDEKRALERLVRTISRFSTNFVGNKRSSEFKEYLRDLVGSYSVLEADQLLGVIRPALLVLEDVKAELQKKHDSHMSDLFPRKG